jgi:3-oxoacyl-[acyl-carrier protein] reductase
MSDAEAPLAGKVALLTGAGRGIGRAIAIGYARAGAAVACAARSRDQIDAVAEEIRSAGGRAIAIPTDVSSREQVEALVQATVDAFGGLDLVVCNAGAIEPFAKVADSDPDTWWSVLEVNLRGVYLTARAAIPHLVARGGGKILTLGSSGGHRPFPTASAYSASKAAMSMFTRSLAVELRGANIAVNELIPGPVITEMTLFMFKGLANNEFIQGSYSGTDWIKQPEDVIPLALFVATQPDNGPSGQVFSLVGREV